LCPKENQCKAVEKFEGILKIIDLPVNQSILTAGFTAILHSSTTTIVIC
jgi:hypothetical protein